MNEVDLRAERTVMAQPFRKTADERPNLELVEPGRRRKPSRAIPPMRRILTTIAALLLLVVVLRFFPPVARRTGVQASRTTTPRTPAITTDLHLSDVQISHAPDGTAIYLDGLVSNAGNGRVTDATADVGFHDAQGRLIATVHKPLVGMSHGGTDLVRNEFARNPITSHEMRFFRIAVEDVPPAWNHEVPELTIIEVKSQ
jgi:hypothetical protein